MKTTGLDLKSVAIGLLFGLLTVSLVGAVGSEQARDPAANYQVAVADAKNGVVIDTRTGEVFAFRLDKPYDEGTRTQVLQVLWQKHGDTHSSKGPTPR